MAVAVAIATLVIIMVIMKMVCCAIVWGAICWRLFWCECLSRRLEGADD